ncbi:MAG: hypothetical protein JSS75_06455 [Bacteroidetes bacterium]|nr:hypothetical protein [Bacteroidota bacterium]
MSSETGSDGVHLDLSVGDTTFLHDLLRGALLNQSLTQLLHPNSYSEFDSVDHALDSTDDSLMYELRVGKMFKRLRRGHHSFIITHDPYDRFLPFGESFSMLDFNRVNGFFLGLGSPDYIDLGRHDEIGIKFGLGYGFAEHKGQSVVGGEYRIPLGKTGDTAAAVEHWHWLPTIAIGAEYHDKTSTEDEWRTGRMENAAYAFLVREDFRDYFKVDGWNAHLAFRPDPQTELQVEYRSDIYYNLPQVVFHGRWGGMKDLPDNPMVSTGRINSWVMTLGEEKVSTENTRVENIFGDKVSIENLKGRAYLLQVEFGDHHDTLNVVPMNTGTSYVRYILDARDFTPVFTGLNIDTRLRLESETGDVPWQKLSFLGGPSTLPAYKNKVFGGNRMLLLNTELRLSLEQLSSIFDATDAEILVLNDFGYIDLVEPGAGVFDGFTRMKFSRFLYTWGVGIGHANGLQLGVAFRTDQQETGRFFFRFQRSF